MGYLAAPRFDTRPYSLETAIPRPLLVKVDSESIQTSQPGLQCASLCQHIIKVDGNISNCYLMTTLHQNTKEYSGFRHYELRVIITEKVGLPTTPVAYTLNFGCEKHLKANGTVTTTVLVT